MTQSAEFSASWQSSALDEKLSCPERSPWIAGAAESQRDHFLP